MRYAPYFCEENAWHLARDLPGPIADRRVAFVGGVAAAGEKPAAGALVPGHVAMWRQRAGGDDDGAVVWDYHVVVAARGADGAFEVWDLDCLDGAPLPLPRWRSLSFRPAPPAWAPRLRVVGAAEYVATLSSDRSHMRGPDGQPLRPFPPWPAIRCGANNNLARFADMRDPFVGLRVDIDGLAAALCAPEVS